MNLHYKNLDKIAAKFDGKRSGAGWHGGTCPNCGEPRLQIFDNGSVFCSGACADREVVSALTAQGFDPLPEPRYSNGHDQSARHHPADLCQPFELRAEEEIPPRRWLYGRWCARGFVSSLIGKGGAGKTSLYIAECLALATGRNLLGVQPVEASAVWILNLEEPREEMERRIAAAARRYGITNELLGQRLFVDGLPQQPFILARRGFDGVKVDDEAVSAIVERIERHAIALMVADPFVATHALNENDNAEMNAAISVWRSIAARTDAAILLPHHLSKGNDDEGRGASAIRDGVRTSRLVRPMQEQEAERFGLTKEERRQFVLVGDAKNNLAEHGVGKWLRLTSMHLANGDVVGTAEPWTPPGALDDVDADSLDATVAYLVEHGPQRAAQQSPLWFGWKVIDLCKLRGPDERSIKTKAGHVIGALANQARIRRTSTIIDHREVPMWEAVP